MVVGDHNPDINIKFKLEGTVETGPQAQFSPFSLVLRFGVTLRLSYAFRSTLEKNIFLNLGRWDNFQVLAKFFNLSFPKILEVPSI